MLTFNKRLSYIYILLLVGLCEVSYSQSGAPSLENAIDVIKRLFFGAIALVGALVIIMILVGALKMALSLGDPKALQGAHLTWTYLAVGAVVVLGFWILYVIITGVVGADRPDSPGGLFTELTDRINDFMCRVVYTDCP